MGWHAPNRLVFIHRLTWSSEIAVAVSAPVLAKANRGTHLLDPLVHVALGRLVLSGTGLPLCGTVSSERFRRLDRAHEQRVSIGMRRLVDCETAGLRLHGRSQQCEVQDGRPSRYP